MIIGGNVAMYYIFVSHSWKYNNEYEKLCRLLNNSGLEWQDYSIPQDDHIHTNGTDKELKEAIDKKIKCCSCVIIMAGVYSTYSKWIQKEICIAQHYGKKIIAVEGFGSERTSQVVKDNADKVVKWQTQSIIDAIIAE